MTEKPLYLGNIDEQPQNRDWLRIMAKRREAERDTRNGTLSMTYLDPDDLDASWDALQRLIRGGETPDGE